jgi:hypothetical protein
MFLVLSFYLGGCDDVDAGSPNSVGVLLNTTVEKIIPCILGAMTKNISKYLDETSRRFAVFLRYRPRTHEKMEATRSDDSDDEKKT